jgi:hypothetical protein
LGLAVSRSTRRADDMNPLVVHDAIPVRGAPNKFGVP